MTESEATRIANVINYFNEGYQKVVWEAEIKQVTGKEWKVVVRKVRTAFKHELNALMMVIQGTVFTTCNQIVDDDGEIVWRIW